jgi:hypothetical protein
LRPDVVWRISAELAQEATPYDQGKLAAQLALAEMRTAWQAGKLVLEEREAPWLDSLSRAADELPATAEELAHEMAGVEAYRPEIYDLEEG